MTEKDDAHITRTSFCALIFSQTKLKNSNFFESVLNSIPHLMQFLKKVNKHKFLSSSRLQSFYISQVFGGDFRKVGSFFPN